MSELLSEFVQSEAFLKVIVLVVTIVWSLPRVASWRAKIRESQWAGLWDIAIQAVGETWIEVTQPAKRESAGGLTPETVKKSQEHAVTRFFAIMNEKGVGRKITKEAASVVCERAYAALKKELEGR